jgi:cellulose synthase/poly-beta-1,6-N-acetylglucosamine synthase-like glycosyltransferase
MSDYPNLRVIVIDDGSRTARLTWRGRHIRQEIASGRLTVLTKPNGGKAEALNFALDRTEERFTSGSTRTR